MIYLIKRKTEYLHDYVTVSDNFSHEKKQESNLAAFYSSNYTEINSEDMYSFGVLKSEKEQYMASLEYRGEFDNKNEVELNFMDDVNFI